MKRYLLYIVLTVVLSTAGCTRGQWLDEVVAQRDEQEDVVPILRAAKEKGLTVDSAEEIERTNKYYTVDTANGYYNEFKRYRLVFSDQTTVEFDVLGLFNGVKREYYAERGLDHIGYIDLVDVLGNLVIDIVQSDDMIVSLSFQYTSAIDDPNDNITYEIYYTSTDGQVVTPEDAFGANIVSNTYKNGQGVITFDGYVTSIGWGAFRDCSSLASITIPEGVTSIGYYAFAYCSSLASINIPNSVTSIGYFAFGYCSSLTSITIPKSVTSIGEDAFTGCSSLAEFSGKFASEDGRCLIADGVLHFFTPAAGLTEYVIPNGVTTIGRMAFFDCDELVSVTIPDGVTSIEKDAFRDCDNLASINIPEGVTEIGDYAFGITKLTSVTLPESLTSLGYIAFAYCYSLKEVYCKAITPPTAIPDSSYGWDAFYSNASDRKIYVPEESVEAYKTAEWWSDYADAIVGHYFYNDDEDNTTNIPDNEIWYTSTDGNVVTPYATNVFGANIISNTYENGRGVITFAGNVTTIGSHAFESCTSLTSITIPEGVTEIGYQAFYGCSSLASVTLPDSVTEIGGQAFYGCTALTSVTIPDGVTSIGSYVFAGCSGLTEFKGQLASDDGRCLIINGAIHSFAPAGLTGYTIPDGVTSIVATAFYGCASLISITIPDSVTYIGEWAFKDCLSLTSVYCMPTTPPTGGTGRFDNGVVGRKIYVPAESIEAYKSANYWSDYADDFVAYDFENGEIVYSETQKIYYTSTDGNVVTPYATNVFGANIVSNTYENGQGVITFDGNVTKIGGYAFYCCWSLTSITIPDGVTSIGEWAFKDCSSLASVTIPDGVTSIGRSAFNACSSLTSITIPDGVTSIRDYAFYACSSLASITIPESVTSIGEWAFHGCSSLTSITIPDSVTSIGDRAFYNCSSLVEVYSKPTTPPTGGDYIFDNNASDRKIYVAEESVEAYKTADGWSDYADAFVPYDFEKGEVVNLENRKIYYSSTDGNVVTPYLSGTSYFGAKIVSNTYENGQGVITFDGNVTEIGDRAFYDCSSLASITIPDSVTSIGYDAFKHCSSLASVTIGNGVTSIGSEAFYQCSSLASIIIPEGVTEIGFRSFAGCLKLTSITIPNSVTSIGGQAFYDCSSLVSITIPDGVTSIGYSAFYKCSSLASITIPDSVTSIGYDAFSSCSSLAEVYCKPTTPPTAVPSYNSTFNAFDNNASDRKIYVPTKSVGAYKTAEWWSEYANAIEPYVFE